MMGTMQWPEIQEHFPSQWLLIEATRAHSADDRRILDEIAVVDCFSDGRSAMERYSDLHRRDPMRELYVFHTDRKALDIRELNWLGIRP